MRVGLGLRIGNRGSVGEVQVVTSYLFLDGNCLRSRVLKIAERYCDGAELKINWWGPGAGYRKVFYYDAISAQKPGEAEDVYKARIKPMEELHAYLATFDGFRVNEGDTRYRSGRGGQEQKKVDIMIAVDMLTHTIRRNMTEASLLAGDVDFKPLLDALVNEGMFVTLIYPPGATSDELLAAADARRAMTVRHIYDWLTPESQRLFGLFPQAVDSYEIANENCVLISQDGEAGTSIWHHLPDDTVRVFSPGDGANLYHSWQGGCWKTTRLLAKDDYGVDLQAELPAEFAHL